MSLRPQHFSVRLTISADLGNRLEVQYVVAVINAGQQDWTEGAALDVLTCKLEELSFVWQCFGPSDVRCQQVYQQVKALRARDDGHKKAQARAWKIWTRRFQSLIAALM